MEEIRFRGGRRFDPNDMDWLIRRIAMFVTGTDHYWESDRGYRWQLGRTNDWKMDFDFETLEIVVAYRYGVREKMSELRDVLVRIMHFEDDHPER